MVIQDTVRLANWPHRHNLMDPIWRKFMYKESIYWLYVKLNNSKGWQGYTYKIAYGLSQQQYCLSVPFGSGPTIKGDTPEQTLRVLYVKLRIEGEV